MSFRSPFAPPTLAQQARWRQIKTTGKKRYVIKVGVIGWGGTMFVVMTALDLLRHQPVPADLADYIFEICKNLAIWPVAGYCWGVSTWRFYEWHFSRATGQGPTDDA